jgi:hypothetical protein
MMQKREQGYADYDGAFIILRSLDFTACISLRIVQVVQSSRHEAIAVWPQFGSFDFAHGNVRR